jgi:ribosomal protein S18 acetylase RimI-like enzyme
MLADFAAQTAQGRVHVMMAGGKLVGFAVCYHDREGYFLENIAIGPACQDLGYGAQLLNYVEQLAIGACTIRLNTNEKMTENLAWYQHRGFVETARRVEDGFARVYFEKKL